MTTRIISSGHVGHDITVHGGDVLRVDSGGSAIDTTVQSGGVVDALGGSLARDVTVSHGGLVSGAGTLGGDIDLAGTLSGVTLRTTLFGGVPFLHVDSGGAADDITVASGALEVVSSGGLASGGAIGIVGAVGVQSGGEASGEQIGFGGSLLVSSGGAASGDVVGSGGAEYLETGARVSGDFVHSGGVLFRASGAQVSDTVVRSGGLLVFKGDIESGQVVTGGGPDAAETAFDGVTLDAGATVRFVDARILGGGTVSLTTGGAGIEALTVSAGGVLRGPGQVDAVEDYGLVSGVAVVNGDLAVHSGGVADGDIVGSLGLELIGASASASATFEHAGGALVVASGGSAADTTVRGGAVLTVDSGGTLSGVVVAGGTLTAIAGAKVSGGLAIDGGDAIIGATVAAGQTVSFTGASGVLALHDADAFHAEISGLATSAEKVDLAGFVFKSSETLTWAQSGTSGTLTVTDGSHIASLGLIGTYVASDFHLATDGRGGTDVSDPPTATPAHRMAQAIAGFADAGAAGLTHTAPSEARSGAALLATAQPRAG